MAEFHETRMGQQFYDKTMPALVKAIERLAAALETQLPFHGDERPSKGAQ